MSAKEQIATAERVAASSDVGFVGQFAAATKKNFQQKFQAPCSCFCEIFLPILFVFGMVGIWAAVGSAEYYSEKFVKYDHPVVNLTRDLSMLACINGSQGVSGIAACSDYPMLPPPVFCLRPTHRIPVQNICLRVPPYAFFVAVFDNYTNFRPIPSLDDMILAQWVWEGTIPKNRNVDWWTLTAAMQYGGVINFAPSSTATRDLIAALNSSSNLFRYVYGQTFDSVAEMITYVSGTDSEIKGTWASIEVNDISPTAFDVKVRLNATELVWTTLVTLEYYSGGLGHSSFYQHSYFHSGFLSIQHAILDYYATNVLGQPPNLIAPPAVAPMPFVDYTEWIFLQVGASQGYFSLFMVLSFLFPVSQLVKSIVKEKEARIREAMLIMGLGTGSFYVSWFVTYAIQFAITSLISAIIMRITFFPKNNFGVVFFLLFFFSLSSIALAGLLSTIFSKARVSALVSPIIYFLLSIPLFLVDNMSLGVRGILLLLSPTALAQGFNLLANYEQMGGMTSEHVATARDDINMLTVLFMLGIDTIVYCLIALYLDAVFPSEWGTRKHGCFCFIDPYRWFTKKDVKSANESDGRDPVGVFEEENSPNPVHVEFHGLRKTFERGTETMTAVNDLHLKLRENEVTVLLGHNGAGKTTAINLLTGMLEPTAGDCTVYGRSVGNELSQVRRDISLCPQHNILWPELTCEQHLRFYAALKGCTGKQADAAVSEMLHAVDLMDKKDYVSDELSGGQKRKLSVAIAFIGGSRLIILDEPTAGMDVAARRFTWDLIRRMAVGRTILLTTHYMDEADLLGNSIAIMAKGSLRCQGSGMFLKSKYSVGYALTMSVTTDTDSEQMKQKVAEMIPNSEIMPTGAEELSYRLPMQSVGAFSDLFSYIETTGKELGVRGYGVTVTTLEDVFLAIAHDEETQEDGSGENPIKSPFASHTPVISLQKNVEPVETASRSVPIEDPWSEEAEEERTRRRWTTRATDDERTLSRQFTALCMKRLNNLKRDRRTQCLQILLPVCCILLSMLLLLIEIVPEQPEIKLDASMYDNDNIGQMFLDTSNCNWNTQLHSNYIHRDVTRANASAFDSYLLQTFHDHESHERYCGVHCNDISGFNLLFANYSANHNSAEMLFLLYRAALDTTTGTTHSMTMSNFPMPWTDRQDALFSAIRTFMVAIVILIPFTFIPSVFVSWIVKEKQSKAKHLQLVSGMNFFIYWLSNLVFDIASFLVTEFLVIIIFLIFSRDEYVGSGEAFGAIFLLFIFYGFSGAAISYFVAYFFDDHASAQNVVMMANFICGFVLVFLNFMLSIFDSTKSAADVLVFIFRLLPSFCLGDGILKMASLDFARTFGVDKSPFDLEDGVGWDIIFMVIEFPLFMALTLLLDHPQRKKREQQLMMSDELPDPIEGEDEDVFAERNRIEQPQSASAEEARDIVRVKNLMKKYSNGKVAVKNLSFGVHRGEVFAFLGTNGAGKTTTISILCGEHLPTHGRGSVANHDVVLEAQEAQQNIGYCPQFDALLDLLTAKEHLMLYAGLRGVPSDVSEAVAEELIEVCGLSEHRNTLASNMSGGNKRKLSVAISLIGGPSVVFLDEPSAGMDPVARRGLWEVIDDVSKHSSVVLTTHHLEEVEALAHRVAIMVGGQLMCIGDKTHLKNKYGSGFEMQIRLVNESWIPPFLEFIRMKFPESVLRESRSTKYTYALPATHQLSQVFSILEAEGKAVGVEDYAVAQTSIEQVFLRISEGAEDEENGVAVTAQ